MYMIVQVVICHDQLDGYDPKAIVSPIKVFCHHHSIHTGLHVLQKSNKPCLIAMWKQGKKKRQVALRSWRPYDIRADTDVTCSSQGQLGVSMKDLNGCWGSWFFWRTRGAGIVWDSCSAVLWQMTVSGLGIHVIVC